MKNFLRAFIDKVLDIIGIILVGVLLAPLFAVIYLVLLIDDIQRYFYYRKRL
jgi:hypothetical protein